MSTSGSFTPPGAPRCAYDPEMTHAEALALRDAGLLSPNCAVVITDGPVIGTPGNTSPTTIRLNPVTPTDIGRTAQVHTDFDNVAFMGNYNIDGGVKGSLNELTDHWGNTISDEDDEAPTVHTQFPFHLSGPDLRDNTVDDCTLQGWGSLVGEARDNSLKGSTVDLTGRTTGRFNSNSVTNSTLILNAPVSFVDDNQMIRAVVNHLGTGAGTFTLQGNSMFTGDVTVDVATTSVVDVSNNAIGGVSGGYRILVQGKTTGPVTVAGNRLFDRNAGTYELRAASTGTVLVTGSDISSGTLNANGAGAVTVADSNMSTTTATVNGTGTLSVLRASATGSTVTHRGSGVMSLHDTEMNGSTVFSAINSTRGLSLTGCTLFGSNVSQNGTGSASEDLFRPGSTFAQAIVILSATAPATPASTYYGVSVASGGQLNVADHTSTDPIVSCHIETGSILNLSGGGVLTACRLGSAATLNLTNTAANSVIEGQFTKSPAGAALNALANPGFDNWPV